MSYSKYGMDALMPKGDWHLIVPAHSIVGVHHYLSNFEKFSEAVTKAELASRSYTVGLEVEPYNRLDANAIKVIGLSMIELQPDNWTPKKWHIGYLNSEVAKKLNQNFISQNRKLCSRLISIFERCADEHFEDDYVDIKIEVYAELSI